MKINSYILFAVLLFVGACSSGNEQGLQFEKQGRDVPSFNADSAYAEVVNQVEMGPRNPGSEGHTQAKLYLMKQLEAYAGSKSVFTQRFTHSGYENDTLQMANLIAAFNPQSTDRIMLCAHWDTRPRAENDPSNPNKPILGADDGASGAAVLLEMARIFSENPPPIGVDIIFFDGEDYGKEGDLANYFLGSRFWSNNPPVQGYQPRFGILLDMAGRMPNFIKKGILCSLPRLWSMSFGASLIRKVTVRCSLMRWGLKSPMIMLLLIKFALFP